VALPPTGAGFRHSISGTGGGKTEMWVITKKLLIDFNQNRDTMVRA
jgi:hypothetical protein